MNAAATAMRDRFRGFLPVAVDVETGWFIAATDALLEIAAVEIRVDADGRLVRGPTFRQHVRPFEGARRGSHRLGLPDVRKHVADRLLDAWRHHGRDQRGGRRAGALHRHARRRLRRRSDLLTSQPPAAQTVVWKNDSEGSNPPNSNDTCAHGQRQLF